MSSSATPNSRCSRGMSSQLPAFGTTDSARWSRGTCRRLGERRPPSSVAASCRFLPARSRSSARQEHRVHGKPRSVFAIRPQVRVGVQRLGGARVAKRALYDFDALAVADQHAADPADLALGDPAVRAERRGPGRRPSGSRRHADTPPSAPRTTPGRPAGAAPTSSGRTSPPQLRDLQLQVAGRRREHPPSVPVTLPGPLGGPLMPLRADHRRQLRLDQRLVDRRRRRPHPIIDAGRLQRIQHLELGRLVQGHRVNRLYESLGPFSQTLTRWPSNVASPRRKTATGTAPRDTTEGVVGDRRAFIDHRNRHVSLGSTPQRQKP